MNDRESFGAIGVLTSAADTIKRAKDERVIRKRCEDPMALRNTRNRRAQLMRLSVDFLACTNFYLGLVRL